MIMKKIVSLILVSAFVGLLSAEAQTVQKGSVKEFNSGGKPIEGVQIAAMGAIATDTDGDGRFSLEFASMSPGNLISLPEIYKKGYEVVNGDSFNGWVLSEKKDMNIVLAKAGVIDDAKNMYYEVAMANFSRKQSELVNQINQLYTQGEMDAAQRRASLEELAAQSQEFMSRLDNYAEKFARINPDDLSELERNVIRLVSEGKIDEAMQLYDASGIVEDALQKMGQSKGASEDARDIVESLYRYADLIALSGEKDADVKVLEIYRKITEAFPEDFNHMFKYATESLIYGREDSGSLVDRCMELAYDDKPLVQVLTMRVSNYMSMSMRYADEALETVRQAEQILLDKDVNMPSGDQMALYANLMLLKGEFLKYKGEMEEAGNVLSGLVVMIEDVLKDSDNPALEDVLKSVLPNAYNNLSDVYVSEPEKAAFYLQKGYEASLDYAGDDEVSILRAEIAYKMHQLSHAQNVMDFQRILELSEEIQDLDIKLYRARPFASNAFQYALTANMKIMMLFNTDPEAALAELQKLEKQIEEEWASVSGPSRAIMEYNVDQLYIMYYTFKADYVKRFEYSVAIQEHVAVLREYDIVTHQANIITGYSYLLQMYNLVQMKNEALALAYEVDAIYSMAKARGYVNSNVVGDIATAYMNGGDLTLALEYFEEVREWREDYIEKNPADWEMKINVANTYNNLALCYSMSKKYRKAFEMQKKAKEQLTPFYQTNKVLHAQNYFSILLNSALYAYQTGNLDEAESFIAEAEATAEELSQLNPNFVSYPVLARLMRGDFMMKTGDQAGEAILKDVLAYRQGTLANDMLLMYLLNQYNTKGGIFVK